MVQFHRDRSWCAWTQPDGKSEAAPLNHPAALLLNFSNSRLRFRPVSTPINDRLPELAISRDTIAKKILAKCSNECTSNTCVQHHAIIFATHIPKLAGYDIGFTIHSMCSLGSFLDYQTGSWLGLLNYWVYSWLSDLSVETSNKLGSTQGPFPSFPLNMRGSKARDSVTFLLFQSLGWDQSHQEKTEVQGF